MPRPSALLDMAMNAVAVAGLYTFTSELDLKELEKNVIDFCLFAYLLYVLIRGIRDNAPIDPLYDFEHQTVEIDVYIYLFCFFNQMFLSRFIDIVL